MAINKGTIRAGRILVDAYRETHSKLYVDGWYKGISEDHTPLLNELLDKLSTLGFSSLTEFFTFSNELEDGWH